MRTLFVIGFAVGLAGCQKSVTPEGCPIFLGDMYAHTQACVAAYRLEKARQAGAEVTECFQTATGWACVSQ